MRYFIALVLFAAIGFYACTKDVGMLPQAATLSDSLLFSMASKTTNQYCYKAANNVDSAWVSIAGSDHPSEKFVLRINKKAKDAMTDNGKLPNNGVYPDSSLLVKKFYSTFPGTVSQYAVMFKDNGSWRWAKYGANGEVLQSFKASSSNCTNCHAVNTRDRVQIFDVNP
ncbi:MAG TPA: hypothetical protein VGF30_07195 [Bacteroidia bacterium]